MIKQRILMIAVFCLVGSWAMAQGGHHRGHHEGPKAEMTEEMKTALNLTPEQRTQLDALKAETETAVQALKEQEGLDRESKRSAMREIHEANKAKFEGILTKDQLVALRAQRSAEHGRREAQLDQVDRKAMREEMRTYHQEKIAPVMLAQRQKLEAQMSVADRASLAEIRSQIEAAHEEKRADRKAESATEGNGKRGRRGGEHAKGERTGSHHKRGGGDMGEQFPAQHEALVAMVAKYDTQISSLLAEVEPQQVQWKADQTAIRNKYITEEMRTEKHRQEGAKEDHPERTEKREQGAKIHFLLQDIHAEKD